LSIRRKENKKDTGVTFVVKSHTENHTGCSVYVQGDYPRRASAACDVNWAIERECQHLFISGWCISEPLLLIAYDVRVRTLNAKPFTSRTNGKAERFIQAILRGPAQSGRPSCK
jgi:hypothetical protein